MVKNPEDTICSKKKTIQQTYQKLVLWRIFGQCLSGMCIRMDGLQISNLERRIRYCASRLDLHAVQKLVQGTNTRLDQIRRYGVL